MKKLLLSIGVILAIIFSLADFTPFVSATLFIPAQLQPFILAGSGVSAGATSITLTSLKDIDGNALTMSNFGYKGYVTIEPGKSGREEQASFTGITGNTLTGVSHVAFTSTSTSFTETSGLTKSHPGGATVVVSNTSGFYSQYAAKVNDEAITGSWTFPVPTSYYNPAIKGYVDSGFISNSTTTAQSIASNLTASGTLNVVGQATFTLAPRTSAAPSNVADLTNKAYVDAQIVAGGVVMSTTTRGTAFISTDPASSTHPIVVGDNDTRVPTQSENDALAGTSGTPSATNKYVTNDDVATTSVANKIVRLNSNGLLDNSLYASSKLLNTFTMGESMATGTAVYVSDGTETSTQGVATSSISQTTSNEGYGIYNGSTYVYTGQTFLTPTSTDIFITNIVVHASNSNPGGSENIVGYIRPTSGGVPSGSTLSTSSISAVGNSTPETAIALDFSSNLARLTKNTLYSFYIGNSSAAPDVIIYGNSAGGYSGGNVVTSTNLSSWTSSSKDLWFTINYVEARVSGYVYKTDADYSTVESKNFVGFTNSSNSYLANGSVIFTGIADSLTGLTTGKTYYLSNTAGSIGTSPGTNSIKVGLSVSSSSLLIKQDNP